MAERRMFAKTIIDSDAFLGMPLSAQALYFHLSMRADDEGFVNSPKKIMRMIGANDGDMEHLIRKRYLLVFDSGVVVIKHWRIHNYIQNDRFKPTLYQEEKSQITTKHSKIYTEKSFVDNQCIQNGYNLDTQVSIGKESIGKTSIEESNESNDSHPSSKSNKAKSIKRKYGEYRHVMLTDSEVSKLQSDFGNVEELIKHLDEYMEISGRKYKNCNLVIRRWVVDAVKEKSQTKNKHAATSRTITTPEYSTDTSIDADVDELKNNLKNLIEGSKE